MALFQTRDLITSTLLAFTNQRRIQWGGGGGGGGWELGLRGL